MTATADQVYLGTVLLERNRWNPEDRTPSFRVSDWTDRISGDGFDGLELWENHAMLADDEEVQRLRHGACPVKIFNAYDRCEPDTHADRERIAAMAISLGAEGMKYNTGKDFERHDAYVESIRQWRAMFAPGFRLLCECHRGSTMADPQLADETLDRLGRDDFGMILHGLDNDEQTVRERFGHYGDRITHLHCNLSAKGLMPEKQVRDRLALLRELGFRGTFTIEFTEGVRSDLSIDDLYRNAVRDLRLLRKCLAAG